MCVLGIDISFLGLIRRLGLDRLDFLKVLKVHLIDWRQTKFVRRYLKLDTLSRDLNRLHPADLANIIEDLSVKHGTKLVKALDTEDAAKVLEEVDPHLKKILIKYLEPEQAVKILMQMPVDETAGLIKMMPRNEARQFLSYLRDTKLKRIEELMDYGENTAGGLMTLDYTSVRPDWTVSQAIEEVKKASPTLHSVLYLYVTGQDGQYHGKFSLRWLLLSPPQEKVGQLVKHYPPSPTLHPSQKINEVAAIMTKYNLLTMPVLDKEKHMIGVVKIDDIMRYLLPNA
jgi:magnesium transporter